MNNFSDILDSHRLKEVINSLEEDRKKLEEIIKKPALNKEQENAIETAKELLQKIDNILAALDRVN